MSNDSHPPRFLIGAALLFWGGMTGQWMIGGILAVMFESARWTRLRWDFGELAFLRAWHLTVLLIAGAMVLIWIDGNPLTFVPRLLGWTPLLLVPVQFTQSFGLRDKIPLSTFSFFARRRWERNRKLGLTAYRSEVNFGHIYIVVAVLASTLGIGAKQYKEVFLAGLVALTAWAIMGLGRGRRPVIIVCLLMAGGMAVAGQFGLGMLYLWATRGGVEEVKGSRQSNFETSIGKLGEVKQSHEIMWRIKTLQGPTPTHLQTATFNFYNAGRWSYQGPPPDQDFKDLVTVEPTTGDVYFLGSRTAGPEAISPDLPRISIRGAARSHVSLPVPGSVTSLHQFDFDGVDRNVMGTIRIFPKESVIQGDELWSGLPSADYPPVADSRRKADSDQEQDGASLKGKGDLRVNDDELPTVKALVDELGLRELPLNEKLMAVRNLFATKFRYTRYLSIPPVSVNTNGARSAISVFLTRARAGHCEYFATAATLLLREAGVPTRYAVGFAVMEQDIKRRESVIRGTHGHAWCRVWDEARGGWIDFDPTPADWLGLETPRPSRYQALLDWTLRVREDFFLWRNEPGNRLLGTSIILGIGLLGAGVIARSLWKSRRQLDREGRPVLRNMNAIRTPLHDLEPQARKLLGERAPGVPFGTWLAGLKIYLPDPPLLDAALGVHSRLRFDPIAEDQDAGELKAMVHEITAALRGAKRR